MFMLLLASVFASEPSRSEDQPPEAVLSAVEEEPKMDRGVGFGFDSGMWRGQYGSGFKASFPFHENFALQLRTVTIFADTLDGPGFAPTNMGGVDLVVLSPFFAERFRFVGGGGPVVAIDANHTPAIGVNGTGGIQGFVSDRVAFSIDVGGQLGLGAAGNGRGVRTSVGGLVYFGKQRGED